MTTIPQIDTHGPAGQLRQIDALSGVGLSPDLAPSEAASWRRFLPGKLPWEELAGYEQEITRLEERRREIEAERVSNGEPKARPLTRPREPRSVGA